MKKKLLSALLTMTMAATLLMGCGSTATSTSNSGSAGSSDETSTAASDASSSDGVEVGIVLPTKDEPRWLQDQAQFEKILNDAGFSNQVLFSQGSSATEKTNVETLISEGIKVLIICPQDATAAAAAVEEANDAGIKVISYDRLITDTDAVDYYVTFDSFSVGAAQGQYDSQPHDGRQSQPFVRSHRVQDGLVHLRVKDGGDDDADGEVHRRVQEVAHGCAHGMHQLGIETDLWSMCVAAVRIHLGDSFHHFRLQDLIWTKTQHHQAHNDRHGITERQT